MWNNLKLLFKNNFLCQNVKQIKIIILKQYFRDIATKTKQGKSSEEEEEI